jgi:hypothetical protein
LSDDADAAPIADIGSHNREVLNMAVNVCLPLFGNPGHELEEGAAVRGQQLREMAAALQERLSRAADTLDKLAAAGWSASVAMHDVLLSRPDVHTAADAATRLREAGVDPEALMIVEEVDEDDVV